jgi:hypothetical protein
VTFENKLKLCKLETDQPVITLIYSYDHPRFRLGNDTYDCIDNTIIPLETQIVDSNNPKKGDTFTCVTCGMTLVCTKDCACAPGDTCPVLQCCGVDLVKS